MKGRKPGRAAKRHEPTLSPEANAAVARNGDFDPAALAFCRMLLAIHERSPDSTPRKRERSLVEAGKLAVDALGRGDSKFFQEVARIAKHVSLHPLESVEWSEDVSFVRVPAADPVRDSLLTAWNVLKFENGANYVPTLAELRLAAGLEKADERNLRKIVKELGIPRRPAGRQPTLSTRSANR